MKQHLIILYLAFLLFIVLPTTSSLGQEAPVNDAELDRWRGASLGIRISKKGQDVLVGKVHDHVSDTCPLRVGDRILVVDGQRISADQLLKLGGILELTQPGTGLSALIERDGQKINLTLPTYRRELVDIPTIVEQLKSNEIIKDHLKETGRSDYLDSVLDRMVEVVTLSRSPREAAEAINAIIDEIDVSHTALMPSTSFKQLQGQATGDLGLTLQRQQIDGKSLYFVLDRMPGSSGFDSEILLGDEVVSLNGVPLEKSRRLILSGQEHRRGLFFLKTLVGEKIEVEFRRRQNADTQTCMIESQKAVPAEDVIELSARVLESGKNRFGYIRIWNLMSMKTPLLARNVIDEKLSDCEMLILDLRGRGGLIPAVLAVDRMIAQSDIPIVAITDNLTRSAKEMLSLLIKKHPHVTVVGETTAGAVTGATTMQLPSGNGLMYPVLSTESLKRYIDNTVLERVGVEPDIKVDFQLPWCGGNDRLLEAAIETGNQQIQELLKSLL